MTKGKLRELVGKTIKSAEVQVQEAADGCYLGTMHFDFEDGSSFDVHIAVTPAISTQLFKSAADGSEMPEKVFKP